MAWVRTEVLDPERWQLSSTSPGSWQGVPAPPRCPVGSAVFTRGSADSVTGATVDPAQERVPGESWGQGWGREGGPTISPGELWGPAELGVRLGRSGTELDGASLCGHEPATERLVQRSGAGSGEVDLAVVDLADPSWESLEPRAVGVQVSRPGPVLPTPRPL